MKKIIEIKKINQEIFKRLCGVSRGNFEKMIELLKKDWHKQEMKKCKAGRPYEIGGLEEHLLLLLIAYRTYLTQEFLGNLLFKVNKSTICRSLKRIEKIALKKLAIKKNPKLDKETLQALIVDCTEQAVQRPQDYETQKWHYSGKKKRHTRKTEVIIDKNKRIISVSGSHGGSVHDLTIRRRSTPFKEAHFYTDNAYQGYDKEHPSVDFPYKKSKNHPLTDEEKEYNHAISRFRVRIEHVFGQMKVFKSLTETYRYPRKNYNKKFNIIAGITNINNGFC